MLVDAVASGAPPGTLHRFDASEDAVPARTFRSSTHAIGIAEAIELARALGRLPRRVRRLRHRGARSFETGSSLTPAVESAVAFLVKDVLADLEEERCTSAR